MIVQSYTMRLDRMIKTSKILRVNATITPGLPASPAPRAEPGEFDVEDRAALVRDMMAEMQSTIRHFRCAQAGRLAREGISMAHLHVLSLIDEHGDLPMGRLAELLDVSLSNATGLVDRMAERGLVERVRVPDDRRLVLVRSTAYGRQTVEAIEILRRDVVQRFLDRLDLEQIRRMRQVVHDLAGVLAETPGDCPGGIAASGSRTS